MADPILYESDPNKQRFDLDGSFECLGDLDNDLALLDSIPPTDCDLMFPNMNDLNADSTSGFCPEPWFSDFVSYERSDDPYQGTGPFPDGYMFDAEGKEDQEAIDPFFNCNSNNDTRQDMDQSCDFTSSIRQMVEAQAATDTRCSSNKEKRIEASIAVHLQRLQEASMASLEAEPNTNFSSPCSSDLVQDSISPGSTGVSQIATPASASTENTSTPKSGTDATSGGVEFVLDLNMNATTNLPKKHKPRSQAQKDNYIKARKYGACEKHRKQHKRCNCLEKKASRIGTELAAGTTTVQLPRPTPIHVHLPQSKQPVVPSREVANGVSPKSQPTATPISGKSAIRSSDNLTPKNPSSGQYARPSLASTGKSLVTGHDRQAKLQVRLQTEPASSVHAVHLAQRASQHPLLTAKSPTHTKSHAVTPQTPRTVQPPPRYTNYVPTSVSPAVEKDTSQYVKHGFGRVFSTIPAKQRVLLSSKVVSGTVQYRRDHGWQTPDCSFTEYASQIIHRTLAAYSSLWPSAITSLLGSSFGTTAISYARWYWTGQRGLGFCGSPIVGF